MSNGDCLDVLIGDPSLGQETLFHGNPPVRFAPDVGIVPSLTVNLDQAPGVVLSMESEFFVPEPAAETESHNEIIDESQPSEEPSTPPHPQLVMITHDLMDSSCNAVEYGSGAVSVVFALYQGEYYVHDPRYVLNDNTVQEPLPDGGGLLLKQTHGSISEYSALCANAPRTFVNEEHCRLSSSLDACSVQSLVSERIGPHGHGVVVCGSPGEVANDLSQGGEAGRGAFDLRTDFNQTTTFHEFVEQRIIVWTSVSLWAKDQLRQRMAWALFQLLVINQSIEANTVTEDFVAYYDIMVRHAFGNYRNLLKEVAFSRCMADMLSFFKSKSTAHQWTRSKQGNDTVVEYPDEVCDS